MLKDKNGRSKLFLYILTSRRGSSLALHVLHWLKLGNVVFTLDSEVSLLEICNICHHEYHLPAAVPKGTLYCHT